MNYLGQNGIVGTAIESPGIRLLSATFKPRWRLLLLHADRAEAQTVARLKDWELGFNTNVWTAVNDDAVCLY